MNFDELNLRRELLEAVSLMGYTKPTPIQEKTIPPVLAGRDVLGCAQTGTGKTAAFALPILQRLCEREENRVAGHPRALILTPTRELALQIHENIEKYGKRLPVRCAVIFGGVNQNPQVEALRAGVDILVATPGRLNDLIGQGFITLDDIEIFVLDEADRMLDMGFIHDVRRVMDKLPEPRQTLLFSATMPPEVEAIADRLLHNPATVKVDPVTSTVDAIAQSVYFVAKEDKIDLLLDILNRGVGQTLLFVRTKRGADTVARKLQKNGVKALAIHGDKSQNARQNALSQFKNGKTDVLVATDIAARGIDISELPCVVNYNIPEDPETYIHRIGRTGRAGLDGRAISLCCSDELESFRDIEKLIGKKIAEEKCAWSVENMVATKYVRPTRPPKSAAQAQSSTAGSGKTAEKGKNTPAGGGKRASSAQKTAEQAKNTSAKGEKAPGQGSGARAKGEKSDERRELTKNTPQKKTAQKKAGQTEPAKPTQLSVPHVEKRAEVPEQPAVQKTEEPTQASPEAGKKKENALTRFLGGLTGKRKRAASEDEKASVAKAGTANASDEGQTAPHREKPQNTAVTKAERTGANGGEIVMPHRAGVPYYYEPAKRARPSRMPDPIIEGTKTHGGGNEIVTRPQGERSSAGRGRRENDRSGGRANGNRNRNANRNVNRNENRDENRNANRNGHENKSARENGAPNDRAGQSPRSRKGNQRRNHAAGQKNEKSE